MNIEPIAYYHSSLPTKFGVPRQPKCKSGATPTPPPINKGDCVVPAYPKPLPNGSNTFNESPLFRFAKAELSLWNAFALNKFQNCKNTNIVKMNVCSIAEIPS